MKLKHHLSISLIAGCVFSWLRMGEIEPPLVFPWLAGGALVDIDHLLHYFWQKKKINFKDIWKAIATDYKDNKKYIYPFHTIEFGLFLVMIILETGASWAYLSSFILHIFCDGARQKRLKTCRLWLKTLSLTYYARASRSRDH